MQNEQNSLPSEPTLKQRQRDSVELPLPAGRNESKTANTCRGPSYVVMN